MNPNIIGNADDIRARLQLLAAELHKQNATAGLRIVGGAAIALAYNPDRDVTADIDAINRGDETLMQCAGQLAQIQGWNRDWLSDAALMYFPPNADSEWRTVAKYEGLTVEVASPRTLLAMKLNSGRGSREEQDIRTLLAICDIKSIDEAEELFEQNYPNEEMAARARMTVIDYLGGQFR